METTGNNMSGNNLDKKKNKFEDFLVTLFKYRRLIIINVVLITVITIIISLLIPKEYTSRASVLPPKKKGGLLGDIAGFSSAIKDISKTLGRLGTVSEEAFGYLVILESRTSSELVIEKFNLREVYEFDEDDYYEDLIEELRDNVEFNIEDEGNIVISVTDESPKRAAEMANYYIKILNDVSTELSTAEAKNNREFIEKRFIQLQIDIAAIEDSLKNFSKKSHVLAIEEQTKAAISVAAKLTAELEVAKFQRDLAIENFGNDHPLVEHANIQVRTITKQLNTLDTGKGEKIDFLIPFENIPETGVQFLRLKRDYEIQNKILEFIYPLYEQAKLEEQKDLPVVLVLDKAIPPEKKSYPKRTIMVIVAFFLSLSFSIIFVLIKESFNKIKSDPEKFKRIQHEIIEPLSRSKKN